MSRRNQITWGLSHMGSLPRVQMDKTHCSGSLARSSRDPGALVDWAGSHSVERQQHIVGDSLAVLWPSLQPVDDVRGRDTTRASSAWHGRWDCWTSMEQKRRVTRSPRSMTAVVCAVQDSTVGSGSVAAAVSTNPVTSMTCALSTHPGVRIASYLLAYWTGFTYPVKDSAITKHGFRDGNNLPVLGQPVNPRTDFENYGIK